MVSGGDAIDLCRRNQANPHGSFSIYLIHITFIDSSRGMSKAYVSTAYLPKINPGPAAPIRSLVSQTVDFRKVHLCH